ncbi:hypothetical protein QZJ86_14370 [Methylomonas montana]|uniref:hypothetical protein n=1 Tax=Methylomonas montana TaxID=3058963 RepID=UPI00265A6E41|nr:hypothetical protein [Methylomonas montana]WKJ89203.1 hypothetical protein QZJ86_14370 [Methylomonas montana]
MNMRHIRWLMIAAINWAVVSCGFAEETTQTASNDLEIGSVRLRLENHSEVCFVTSTLPEGKSADYDLAIPWPCHFHKDMSGSIRMIEAKNYRYVLVESSKPKSDARPDCETQLRSIRVSGRLTEISQHKELVASCPPFQWDVYMFKELFD